MLTTKEKITITGESTFEDGSAAGFTASIDSQNPEDMTLSVYQNNKALYKTNRKQVRKDQADFEEMAYAKQEELIAKLEAEK